MKLLDLYCCIGGAAQGYADAGFEITGVEINEKCEKHYPFDFINKSVFDLDIDFIRQFDLVHASPKCQNFSTLKHRTKRKYENQIPATRQLLIDSGVDYIIENVPGAVSEMINPVTLCGTMFGLGTVCKDGRYRDLWRHRAFETNFGFKTDLECNHQDSPIGVYGGAGGQMKRGYKGFAQECRDALGLRHYAPRDYVSQAIPGAYTKHIGEYWIGHRSQNKTATLADDGS